MSVKSKVIAIALMFGGMLENRHTMHEEKMAELRQEWRDSMQLPRKKKKAVRKRIAYDMQFFTALNEQDPFNF